MKSYLIIGLGRFGRHMALELAARNHYVLAIDSNEERAAESLKRIPDIQIGDATDEDYIKSLEVSKFDVCVVAVGDNFQSSLEITALLKENNAKFIIARASREVHRKFLKMAGADEIVYAEREIAERLAIKYGSEKITDYLKFNEDYSIYEIIIPEEWVGKSAAELEIRQRYKINVLAVKQNNVVCSMPSATDKFEKGEYIVIMGHNDDLKKFFETFSVI